MKWFPFVLIGALIIVPFMPAQAEDEHKHHHQKNSKGKTTGVCPVSGEDLDKDAVKIIHKGHEYRFCCKKCAAKFEKHPEKYIKEKKSAEYPLTTCVISGEKLGSMGEPFEYTHEGKRVLMCCKSCLKKFLKSPDEYLKKISDADDKQP